jgi:hypothetical protein
VPRQGRIDAPGALHHVIIRGIERRSIFGRERDRDDFLTRLAPLLADAGLFLRTKERRIVEARSLLCYVAVTDLGMTQPTITWGVAMYAEEEGWHDR